MDQRDFNRDMSSYMRKRRSTEGVLDKLRKGFPKVQVIKDDVVPEAEVPVEHVEMVMRGETLEGEDEEEFEEDRSIRVPWYRKIFLFSKESGAEEGDVDMSYLEEDDKPGVDAEIKEMLRICVHWVNRLPSEDIQEIKRTDDYIEFKRLLDKYGLLKKKD